MTEIFSTFFAKPIDKPKILWYNIYVNKRNEVNKMKRNKKNSYAMDDYKWYLVIDGKSTRVVNSTNIAEYETMNVIIVEITASQAAGILLLS